MEILNVYVLHAKHLEVRKPIIENLRKKLVDSTYFKNVNFEYIEEYDPSPQSLPDLKKHVSLDKTNKNELFDNLIKNLHIRQVSNTMKHLYALQKVANSTQKDSISLIIEDDVIFSEFHVDQRLYNTILELKKTNWDINFLGFPQIQNKDNSDQIKISDVNSIYKIIPEISSYLTHPEGANKVLKDFVPIHFNTTLQFSYVYEVNKDVKFTMSSPNIFIDGSKFGVYLSNIEANNKLFLNTDYARLYKLVLNNEEKINANENNLLTTNEFENIKFGNHPEFVSLYAQYLMQIKNYDKAKELFETAYKTYIENDCILNGESEFLLKYSRIFKYFQN